MSRRRILAVGLVLVATCTRPPPLSPLAAFAPARLSQTGLYAHGSFELARTALPYRPAYPLWSDGADKRRWIELPAGARIDTSNADDWAFPVGTRLWKEFSVAGRRVETRLLWRIAAGPDGWLAVAYAWRADDSDADLVIGGVTNARGTAHDIPAARTCVGCHGAHPSFVLGFSAVQLSHPPGEPHDHTLDELDRSNVLTAFVPETTPAPGSPVISAALGYLHANCGSCHYAGRPATATWLAPRNSFDAWIRVGSSDTATRLAPKLDDRSIA